MVDKQEQEIIKVILVDDHKIVLNGIQETLLEARDIKVVATALSGAQLIANLELHPEANVVILDINLPDIDGMELCKKIKKTHPKIGVIGLTTFSQASFIAQMLRNGANGYLFKNTSEEELLQAIRAVHAGSQYLSQEVNRKLLMRAMSKKASDKTFIPKLTRRETEVLQLIIEEHTNQEIADKLYLSVSTVETHRMNLCSKLDARNTAGLVKKAIKFGLAD